jgi:DNA-binding NarL/FixJ family response regulator
VNPDVDWPLVGRSAEFDRVAGALARPECSGVVLIGPGGVGKTRLATECLALAEQSGFSTARAVATRSTSTITLGALAPLLPDLGDKSLNLLGAAREALAQRAGTRPLLLFVDDGHLLDEVSAALLLQIASERQIFVLVTVRTGEEVSDAITALWKDAHAERIDIEPLPDLDLDQLIVEALGGTVEPNARSELLRISEGNPLALRELILAARDADRLVEELGVWRLSGPIAVSNRLSDLVADRLDSLDEQAYEALEVLALGEPLGVTILEELSSSAAVELLERKGLARIYEDEKRLEAWLAHPLYGEVVRTKLGRMRTRNVLRALADAIEGHGAHRRGDLLRIATWRLESGSATNPEMLTLAGRQAFIALDFQLAKRLGRAAWGLEETFEAGHLLGHVLTELGERDEAEAVLAIATDLAQTDQERVLVAMARTENLFRGEQPDVALEVNLAAEDTVADPTWKLELVGHRATFLMALGQIQEALDLVQPAIEGDAPRPFIEAAITAGTVLAWDGLVDDALDILQRAYGMHLEVWENELFQSDPGIHAIGIISSLANAGNLDDAEQLLAVAWESATEQHAVHAQAWFGLLYGNVMTSRGRPTSALQWYDRASACFGASALKGRQQWAIGGALQAAALLGRLDLVAQYGDQLDAVHSCVRLNEVLLDEARAWALVANGDLERARELLDVIGDRGIETRSRVPASIALHSLARLGAPERAVERMRALGGQLQGRLIAARVAHVEALVEQDPATLAQVAATFAEIGALLLAAEAEADCSRAYRKAGRSREAAAAAQRSQALAKSCEGANTPALALVDEVTPLTRREREVSMLAAQGLPSKDIAEKLFLSVRTVENHLQRAYEKLGVSSRDGLARVLAGTE